MSYYSDVVIEVPLEEYEYWLSLDDHDLQTTLEFADLNATTVTNDTRVLGWKCLAWEDDCKDAGIKWILKRLDELDEDSYSFLRVGDRLTDLVERVHSNSSIYINIKFDIFNIPVDTKDLVHFIEN